MKLSFYNFTFFDNTANKEGSLCIATYAENEAMARFNEIAIPAQLTYISHAFDGFRED